MTRFAALSFAVCLFGSAASAIALSGTPYELQTVNVQNNEKLIFQIDSQGCFHSDTARLTVTAQGASVGDKDMKPFSLDSRQKLDSYISRLASQSGPGGCTTRNIITVTRYRNERIIASGSFTDDYCMGNEVGVAISELRKTEFTSVE